MLIIHNLLSLICSWKEKEKLKGKMVRITPKITMVKSIMLVVLLTSSWLFLIDGKRPLLHDDQLKNQLEEEHQLEIEDNQIEVNDKHHECYRTSYSCWKTDEKVGNNNP
ncbi:unnamed protein product [Citrullus colocynthis]|uniref:Uncharacterized protein n=1 Tax=Citrullus colocynthis TaxID=252529 RepID=A0ABP0XSP9_9ROSI